MYICTKCNATYNEKINFCRSCGGPVTEVQQQSQQVQEPAEFQQSAQSQYINTPEYNPAPSYNPYGAAPYSPYAAPASASKAPAILGMVFGIINVFITMFMFMGILSEINSYYGCEFEEALIIFSVFSVFILPLAIVGLIMSFKSTPGSGKGMAIAGRITGFIAIGLYMISFFMVMACA